MQRSLNELYSRERDQQRAADASIHSSKFQSDCGYEEGKTCHRWKREGWGETSQDLTVRASKESRTCNSSKYKIKCSGQHNSTPPLSRNFSDKVEEIVMRTEAKRQKRFWLFCGAQIPGPSKFESISESQLTEMKPFQVEIKGIYLSLSCSTSSEESGGFPGWCSSVDWVPACEPKGCRFDSQSGHIPGVWARSQVGGAWEATTHWHFHPSLSPSLPLPLKINK